MVKLAETNRTLHRLLVASLLVGGVACSSSAPKPVAVKDATARETSARPTDPESTMITGVRSETSPAPKLIVVTSGAPAYSSYSPQPDVFVVDFAGATKGNGVEIPSNLPEFVASVSLDEAVELGKPLTRMTVRLKTATEASVGVAPEGVAIRFVTSGAPESVVEQIAPIAEPIVQASDVPAALSAMGGSETTTRGSEIQTPREPEAEPTGRAAKILKEVRTSGSGETLRISLEADGVLSYKTFKLSNPLRVVFDLTGVRNGARSANQTLSDPYVQRIRVSQFQIEPVAITRVVLDLDEIVDYQIHRKSDSMTIAFGEDSRPATPVERTKALTASLAPETNPFLEEPAAPRVEVANARPIIHAAMRDVAPATDFLDQELSAEQPANTKPPQPSENVFLDAPTQRSLTRPIDASTASSRLLSPIDRIYEGEPIDLTLKDADIKDVLRTFAQITGLNIAIDPQVRGSVTVEFIQVPWDQAFELILRQNGLTFVREGNVIRVGTLDRLSAEQAKQRRLEDQERLNVPLQTVIKPLSYAEASDVIALLKSMASPRGKIVSDERTNQLVITEIPTYMATLLNLIDTIDIPTPQVLIEARVVETTKVFIRNLGIQWGFNADLDPAFGTGTGLIFPNRINTVGGPFNLGAGNPVLDISLGNVLGTFDLDLLLTAAESEGLLRVVSAPKVQTQDNSQAQIQSGVQIPVQTRVNFTTTVAYIDATLKLTVRPHITSDDTVIMKIDVQKNEPAPGLAIAGGDNFPITTRKAVTTLRVANGATTVIGGIYQTTDNQGQSRVPFLHEIPIIGNLFKNRTIDSRHDELLIFITPRIVR